MSKAKFSLLNWGRGYSVPSSVLSMRMTLGLLIFDLLFGLAGFMWIEKFSFIDALYMWIITISTVGFTEVQPLSDTGRLFTFVLIVLNIGIFAYLLSAFSYFVIQGEIFKDMHTNLINRQIEKLSDHIILCGYGRYGQEISTHFINHRIPFVIVDSDPEKIDMIQRSELHLLYINDDATQDEVLEKAGISRARAVISALADDSDNLFIVLTARQLNPRINIISRAQHPKSQKKLRMAGASHVVMPEQIGGFYMATLVSKPGAVEFFSYITNEHHSDVGFEEITHKDLSDELRGKAISDLHLRFTTGANIIGYKDPQGRYIVNPPPNIVMVPGSSFIILGDENQLKEVRKFFNVDKRFNE